MEFAGASYIQALTLYEKAVQIFAVLAKDAPDFVQWAEDRRNVEQELVLTHMNICLFYQKQGDKSKAAQSLAACFAILDSFVRTGRPMDVEMQELYGQLKPMFSESVG